MPEWERPAHLEETVCLYPHALHDLPCAIASGPDNSHTRQTPGAIRLFELLLGSELVGVAAFLLAAVDGTRW